MRSTFDEVAKELEELRTLVASITPVNSALAGHHDSLVRQYLTIRRRFDYAAFVVALYAAFETFIENLVASYARLVALQSQYDALPMPLTRKHITKSAEILARGRIGGGRYVGIREVDLVKNLFDCLSGASPHSLNDVAIVAHDRNLRYSEINELFKAVGIANVCERARRADAMLEWFCAAKGLSEPSPQGVPVETIRQRIDDIVERRNQVTHGGGSPLNLAGPDEMADTVGFVEALGKSIFAMTVAKYLHGRHVESGRCVQLRVREGPYQDSTVVVVEKPGDRIYVGQPVFVLFDTAGVRWGRITSLQVDDISVSAVDSADSATTVGVAVDFKCPKNKDLFALESDDDVVWNSSSVDPTPPAVTGGSQQTGSP